MFIFKVTYFLLILNPEIKFIILKKTVYSKVPEIMGKGYWERFFII